MEYYSAIKKDERSEQTFLQLRHTDGQGAYEKMLSITNYQRDANQNYNEISAHTSQHDYHKKKKIHK